MTFRKEINDFVNLHKRNPKNQENIFYKNEYVDCNLKSFYTQYCDETSMITNIDTPS